MSHTQDYSQLSAADETWYILSTFFVLPIGLALAIIIISLLYQQRRSEKNLKSLRFAIISVFCSILMYLTSIFFANNLLIRWQFDDEHQLFVSMTDALFISFWVFGKMAFYCSFTYYLLNIFDEQSKLRKYLFIWMIIACFALFICSVVYTTSDITQTSSKEIGIAHKRNFYVTMLEGHEGSSHLTSMAAMMGVIVDILYFAVLLICYMKQLRNMSLESDHNAIKPVSLISVACLIFWIAGIILSIRLPFRWIGVISDVLSDDICLFLLFDAQTAMYKFWCACCDKCCSACYGSQGYEHVDATDDE